MVYIYYLTKLYFNHTKVRRLYFCRNIKFVLWLRYQESQIHYSLMILSKD